MFLLANLRMFLLANFSSGGCAPVTAARGVRSEKQRFSRSEKKFRRRLHSIFYNRVAPKIFAKQKSKQAVKFS
jgi:hypothetical protein